MVGSRDAGCREAAVAGWGMSCAGWVLARFCVLLVKRRPVDDALLWSVNGVTRDRHDSRGVEKNLAMASSAGSRVIIGPFLLQDAEPESFKLRIN